MSGGSLVAKEDGQLIQTGSSDLLVTKGLLFLRDDPAASSPSPSSAILPVVATQQFLKRVPLSSNLTIYQLMDLTTLYVSAGGWGPWA